MDCILFLFLSIWTIGTTSPSQEYQTPWPWNRKEGSESVGSIAIQEYVCWKFGFEREWSWQWRDKVIDIDIDIDIEIYTYIDAYGYLPFPFQHSCYTIPSSSFGYPTTQSVVWIYSHMVLLIMRKSIREIFKALLLNRSLIKLELENNRIGKEALQALAEGLGANGTLKKLNLR